MLGQVLISVIGITCVLGMTCIVISFFVPDPLPVRYIPDPRYTNCTKPQQTYSGQKKKTTTNAEIFTGRPDKPLPKINQGQYINGAWVADAIEFLESDAEFEVDDDLLE